MTEDFRKNAPTPLAPRSFNLPTPNETVLSNGLKLIVVEDNRLPIISFRLAFKTGSANDPADLPGLTSMIATMINEGTEKRTSLQIASEVENLGASLSSSAGADSTVVAASSLAVYTNKILDLMADVVLNPSFPDEELHLQRDNSKQGLIAQRAQPSFLSDERLSKVLFGEHPYSIVSATEESLDKLTRERLEEFHRQMFVPNNAVFVAVGDVKADELKQTLENLFGGWENGVESNNQFSAPLQRTGREIYLVDRPASAQSNIVLANLAIDRSNPDYFPLLVMNQVLGAGASSRLFMNLREQKDFTYGAYSSIDARRSAGAFEATSEVRSSVTGDALKEFFYELDRIRDEEVPSQELQDAKNYMTGVFPIRLETQEGLINQLVTMQMYNLPSDYLQTYRDKINEITAADVQRVAQEYITPDKMAVVIVGDENTIYEQIQPYAENIQLYDAQGNQKERNKMNNDVTSGAGETWNLSVSSPQGNLPITMLLMREGESITGTLNTPVGDGAITGGTISDNNLTATASLSFQGMPVNVKISGTIDGDSVSGSIDTGMLGSLPFTGTKAG
ncbi:MAG: pitrilysin family protein [Pyrinomonadaceae bacterium]